MGVLDDLVNYVTKKPAADEPTAAETPAQGVRRARLEKAASAVLKPVPENMRIRTAAHTIGVRG